MSSIPWPSPRRAFAARIKRRASAWARKRQGRDATTVTLEARRVYILPTGVGLVYGLMVFAMLLGSMNYNNNLSFVLTFLLASLGFVSMHVCQRNLVGLEIRFAGVEPVHAGQLANFRIAVTNHAQSHRHQIQLYTDDHGSTPIRDIGPGESRVFELEVPTTRRGWVNLPRFGIRTLFPFELMRSWAWLHMDLAGLVYPSPAEDAADPPHSHSARGHRQHDARGDEDFAGLRSFQDGDSPRHVAWKAYARGGELLSKHFSGADLSSQWFDFNQVARDDVEERLQVLTRWIVDAERLEREYGLRLQAAEFVPSRGAQHRHRCLEALALFGTTEGAGDG